jgi:hypothetical protein
MTLVLHSPRVSLAAFADTTNPMLTSATKITKLRMIILSTDIFLWIAAARYTHRLKRATSKSKRCQWGELHPCGETLAAG